MRYIIIGIIFLIVFLFILVFGVVDVRGSYFPTPTLWNGTEYPTVTQEVISTPTYYFYTSTPNPYPDPIDTISSTAWIPYPEPQEHNYVPIIDTIIRFFRGFFIRAE